MRAASLPWPIVVRRRATTAILTLSLAWAAMFSSAAAQAKPHPRDAHSPTKSIVKFDGDTIDGDLMRPDGDLMAGRPELPMPSLVEPPRSFETARRETILSAADAVASHHAQNNNTARR